MTSKNDVIRMARASGLDRYVNDVCEEPFLTVALGFARLVAAAEQEAIIRHCEALQWREQSAQQHGMDAPYQDVIDWVSGRARA